MKAQDFVRPGDCLLYRSGGLVGWIIKIKTWHAVSHCEAYIGGGRSVASRGPQDGKGGVGTWDLRLDGLAHILRPIDRFDLARAAAWFKTVDGQKYDFLGLLCFTLAVKQGDPGKMFCSEFLTRWYRAGGLEPFQRDEDADKIAPCQFLLSPRFDHLVVDASGEVSWSVELEGV